jgi:hypothetical protein
MSLNTLQIPDVWWRKMLRFAGLNVTVPQIPDSDLVPLTFTLNGISPQSLFTAVHQ